MLGGMRNEVVALACIRHGLDPVHGRGVDRLPPEVTEPLARSLVAVPVADELTRAFAVVTEALRTEIDHVDARLAERVAAPLRELTEPSTT